ncbi:MAG: hypothetical protein JWP12_1600 [Bacteroidetes bacterium]|nr:hypothetical protein [Bacteroidota bacterium]
MEEKLQKRRLLEFADKISHLPEGFVEKPVKVNMHVIGEEAFDAYFILWPFEDMPEWYEEWRYKRDGSPVLVNIEKGASTIHSIIDWFGLDLLETLWIFTVNFNHPDYGKSKLAEDSTPIDLANHISDFINRKFY